MKPKFLNQPSIITNSALNAKIDMLDQVNIINWLYNTVKRESLLNQARTKINPRRPYAKVKEYLNQHGELDLDTEIIEELMVHENDYL